MAPRPRLLLVDDEPRMTQILALMAGRWGYEVRTAKSGAEALALLAEAPADVVVSDLKMPGMGGDKLLAEVRRLHPETSVVMMTAHATVKSAVDAMKAGAFDYIMKPFDNDELRIVIERAMEHRSLVAENQSLKERLGIDGGATRLIGSSPPMRELSAMIDAVAPKRATVLITGESGVGKELVARAIHERSTRAGRPFVAMNCAALTETLLESELFGHERGAFTGADRVHRGKFEEADGGTIFLDEIGETTNNFQTKLLRVLQEGVFERVGGTASLSVDVRVLAATNRNLEEEVRAGRFREDLFYRLQVVPIAVPPLRARRDDIPGLARHFVAKACRGNDLPAKELSDAAVQRLAAHPWPGNVRELENAMERAAILTPGSTIEVEDLWLGGEPSSSDLEPGSEDMPLSDFVDAVTRQHVLRTLDRHGWRKSEAAEALGIDRATLYRMIKRFGIDQEGEAMPTPAR